MPKHPPDHLDRIATQWRTERPDLDAAPLATLGRLFRITHLADEVLGSAMAADYGLGPGWFDILAALRRSGGPCELTPTALRRTVLITSGGLTKRIDRLEEAGLVERRPDPADRRGTLVALTRRGRDLIDEAIVVHIANERRILAALSHAERRTLDDLLRRVLAGLDEPEVRSAPEPARAAEPGAR